MSLLEELLAGPGPQERFMQLSQLQGLTAGGNRPPTPGAISGVPTGMLSPGTGATPQLARRIADWIESVPGTNFQVSGLEGFQGTGQISSGHIENSQHYTGHAGDVTYQGGRRFDDYQSALDWLNARLQRRWGDDLTELIWRAPDHYTHLHYGTRPGG